ncbi:carbon starvation protein A [Natrinema thermotolerans]|uniref:Carbon starvation protein A n=1 Tax=Natrinema thermotolerans TaxID=121872 RepID=A0AAF0T4Z9_9EURY|nr:carbon starvation CstA family protein [Natrinema thermotolerans]ELZ12378.1 carbon starvation protein CstA [Natrinema thermotolerans DSM 11552]QCC59795.1 carbon starvation protein A [Natrinema thermotolerans]WMT06784.1 carbon starvation protein A [Natrinema thermotolerans]
MTQVIWIIAAVLVTFTVGYVGYSRYLTRFVELDEDAETPAHKYEDGQEYVPSKKPVLLGHHYSSIAGGAPIVGPITAGAIWGWVPALLWIAIGNPLMGAVHDFVSLSGSLRHEGKSIGYMIGEYVGESGKNMLLWFAFLTIILVVAVFALVVGIVFNAYPQVVTASLLYIGLALAFGVYLYQFNGPFIPGTILFVAGVFAAVWVGLEYPLALFAGDYPSGTIVLFGGDGSWVPGAAALEGIGGGNTAGWVPIILVYAAVASALPVWVLLQPRDYLSSFLLYAGVGGATLAIIVGTFFGTANQDLVIDSSIAAFEGFWGAEAAGYAPLFPLLFITIACGTISGFHSLVSSGTTAKQLDKETDARLIGYGGMLGEGLLAAVALSTLAVWGAPDVGGGIGAALPNFASGGGVILTSFGVPETAGAVFMALVLCSFLLTSTDTAVRLGRYMMEEIVGTPAGRTDTGLNADPRSFVRGRYTNPIVQAVPAYLLVISGQWVVLWQLFGGANQLLAALALLTATVWLANWDDSKQLVSTGVPMAVMVTITVLGLSILVFYENLYLNLIEGGAGTLSEQLSAVVQMALGLVLIGLALALVRLGYRNISRVRRGPETPAAEPGDD